MTREPRITMAKEVLSISTSKVRVDYDFRNNTDSDITTEVAFPVPAFTFDYNGASPKVAGFDDFRLWIEGKHGDFATEIRAFAGKRDVTNLLKKLRIDVASFGRYRYQAAQVGPAFPDIARLNNLNRSQLVALKLIDEDNSPLWRVEKRYHWTQTFPAHTKIHIRHEYTPVLGSTNSVRNGLSGNEPAAAKELDSICISPALRRILTTYASNEKNNVPVSYVDFILTTANTWKKPIGDFTLDVERPQLKGAALTFVSFCWNASITKVDQDHFSVHTTNLIPTKELRIGFISVYKGD